MRDVEALIAEAKNPDAFRLEAYYYSFEPTGVIEIDRILSAVARAGKAFHNTEQWDEDAYGKWTPVELIQTAANEAAKALEGLVSAPVKGGGTLADLIDAVIAEWQENQWSDHPKESKPLADTVADAVLAAGFRLPVVPVPVYEYGVLVGELKTGYVVVDGVDDEYARMSVPTKRVRRAGRYGVWELVPVGVDKP